MNNLTFERDCQENCRSVQHGYLACAAITHGRNVTDEELLAYLHWLCSNAGSITDSLGRTPLHIAASCGRKDIISWLLNNTNASINTRDYESGYTALHRSIFYGHLHIGVALTQMGANMLIMDNDDLTSLDHALKDKLSFIDLNKNNPCEVYVWGTNNNYNLGTENQHSRQYPELLEFFRKHHISIMQVAMHKFHSVFLSHDGSVYSCGHGQGGRLGLDSEKSTLSPHKIKLPSAGPEVVTQIAVGQDHTVLLTESGNVYTCGLNSQHQLGHSPPPPFLLTPRALSTKVSKLFGKIFGVCAARFHTVIWGKNGLFSCGLHAGQLGHPKSSETTIILPTVVKSLHHKDCHIVQIAVSDGATVAVTTKGDIYVLHEYSCKKLPARLLNVVKICVLGGHLDSNVDSNILMNQGGEQLRIAVLTTTGELLLWKESSTQFVRCFFNINRSLRLTDFALNRTQLLLVSIDGEAFQGEIKAKKLRCHNIDLNKSSPTSAFHDVLEKDEREIIKIKRLPNVHRAVCITSDLKGRNFCVLQVSPKFGLWEVPQINSSTFKEQMHQLLQEAHPDDSLHDVIFQIGSKKYAAHHYVIACSSEPLDKLIKENKTDSSVTYVKIDRVKDNIFEQILQYIYTSDCSILHSGPCPIQFSVDTENRTSDNVEQNFKSDVSHFNDEELNSKSAFEVHSGKRKKKEQSKNMYSDLKRNVHKYNPVRLVQEAAKKFGLTSLVKKLDQIKFEEGFIVSSGKQFSDDKNMLNHDKHIDLYDVCIKCENRQEIRAHKCILSARLEYFKSMLCHGWIESGMNKCLSFPAPYDILHVLIKFIYEDESSTVLQSEDYEFVCNVLILADQLLVNRLKEICEVSLTNLLTLRNVSQILQFADTYNADQLKTCCMQYVCINLSAIMESRSLEGLADNVLEDLSKYYRELNPRLNKRLITPYSDAPNIDLVKTIAERYPIDFDEITDGNNKRTPKLHFKKLKSKKPIPSSVNKNNERVRNESVSSNASHTSDDADNRFQASNLIDFHENDLDEYKNIVFTNDISFSMNNVKLQDDDSASRSSPDKNSWIKINNKPKNTTASRLKAIIAAKEVVCREELSFQPLQKLGTSSSENLEGGNRTKIESRVYKSTHLVEKPTFQMSTQNFPDLQASHTIHDHTVKISHKHSDIKKPTKISQKQMKKIAEEIEHRKSDIKNTKEPWVETSMSPTTTFSLSDIMRQEAKKIKFQYSSSPSTHRILSDVTSDSMTKSDDPENISNAWMTRGKKSELVKFSEIVADEKKQRENWTKMRDKPLQLTQLEDRAIEDLLTFYNAASSLDERITVQRVVKAAVAPPLWITSHSPSS